MVNLPLTGWEEWNVSDMKKELRSRLQHFFLKVDGVYQFPNSLEGDLLTMVHVIFEKEEQERQKLRLHVSKTKLGHMHVDPAKEEEEDEMECHTCYHYTANAGDGCEECNEYSHWEPTKKKSSFPLRCTVCKKPFAKNEEPFRYHNVEGTYCESCAEKLTPGMVCKEGD